MKSRILILIFISTAVLFLKCDRLEACLTPCSIPCSIYLTASYTVFYPIQSDTIIQPGDTTIKGEIKQKEKLLENLQDEKEDSELLELLEYIEDNPYDLNSVTFEQLEQIPALNSVVIRNIIEYRNKYGFSTKRELLEVKGISEDVYDNIKSFLYVKGSTSDFIRTESGEIIRESSKSKTILFNNFGIKIRSRFLQDLQTREGFFNGKYLGTKPKVYNQARLNYEYSQFLLEGNATIEKDPGEESLSDFTSGFIALKDYKFIRQAIVGDYLLNFGQGLGMWTSLAFSKSTTAVDGMKRSGVPMRGYTSVNESQFFRGAATQLNYKNFDLSVFYSDNYYDGSIDTTLNEFTSFYFDGYHRTVSEKDRTNAVKEKLFGSRFAYTSPGMRFGTTFWTSKFSKNIGADSTTQLYNFSGNKADMLSVDYDVIYRNMNLYGEFARSQSGAVANVNGLQFTFYKIADLIFIYRNYPEDFAPVHSFGFGEKSGATKNERGFYAGIKLRPLKSLLINSYFDQYKFPYRSYFEPVPLTGNDFLTYVEWKATRNLTLFLRYKNETKEETRTVKDEFNRDVKKVDSRNQLNVRTGFEYDISDKVRVKGRFDYVFVDYENFGGNNKGMMFYSDLRAIPFKGFTINTRLIYFRTDSYDSRLYEFENDIKGILTNLALYGEGRRWYIVLKYKPFDFLELSAKYAETYIDGATSIGSGNDKILNDINNRLNFGMELQF
ncbi:MAG: helix-hairpin-helix domain-containing protein [Ignavibacteria bacterium]|nr:helix-hairpin-helix domain-containing protein [Ignavibacteria bacterium]